MPLTTTTSSEPHCVVFSSDHDPQAAIVSLYGYAFRIDLGPGSKLSSPAVVICQIDGSGLHLAGADETRKVIDNISSITFSQPWKRSHGGGVCCSKS
jgi:hypothetical protein